MQTTSDDRWNSPRQQNLKRRIFNVQLLQGSIIPLLRRGIVKVQDRMISVIRIHWSSLKSIRRGAVGKHLLDGSHVTLAQILRNAAAQHTTGEATANLRTIRIVRLLFN
jgi:hypothetical protein